MKRRGKRRDESRSSGLQDVLFKPRGDWHPPAEFPCLSAARRIAVDCETRDPHLQEKGPGFIRGDAYVAGVSLAVPEGQSWYFPIRHEGGGNLDSEMVIRFLRDVMTLPCEKAGANLAYDLEALWSLGVECRGRLLDVQIAEALIDEERVDGYSLEALCLHYLGQRKDEGLLKEAADAYGVHPKQGLWKLPSKYVGQYAQFDAACCLPILERQERVIEEQGLGKVWDLETRLLPVLHKMRISGIPVDLDAARALSGKLQAEEEQMHEEMRREWHRDVNPNSPTQIASVCDSLGIEYPRSDTGQPSFRSDWIEDHTHKFIQAVGDLREIRGLREKFVDKWIFENEVKGRVHPTWKQLASDEGGTRTGRLAASNPSPQQIPAGKYRRTGAENKVGKAIRALFIPEEGQLWAKIDYAGQEPRILVHFAALCGFHGAEAAALAYRMDPSIDFYRTIMCPVTGIDRRPAKDMFLGFCYGMGEGKMAMKLGKSKAECKRMLDHVNEKLPFISQIADKCSSLAQSRGYVRTLSGRRRRFNFWEPADAWKQRRENPLKQLPPLPREQAEEAYPRDRLVRAHAHKGLNSVIQGSAADMMKWGLVLGYETQGRVPHITVHDEVGGSVRDEADAKEWLHLMEHCVETCVPMKGELETGEHWR